MICKLVYGNLRVPNNCPHRGRDQKRNFSKTEVDKASELHTEIIGRDKSELYEGKLHLHLITMVHTCPVHTCRSSLPSHFTYDAVHSCPVHMCAVHRWRGSHVRVHTCHRIGFLFWAVLKRIVLIREFSFLTFLFERFSFVSAPTFRWISSGIQS